MALIPDLPDEVSHGLRMLEQFERCKEHSTRVGYFEEAMEMFDDYLEYFPDDPHRGFISNVTSTYTEKLLEKLPSLLLLDLNDWLGYTRLLFLVNRCSEQVKLLAEKNEGLKKNLREFISVWLDELQEKLVSRNQSEMSHNP